MDKITNQPLSIVDAIGNTPVVELKNITRDTGGRIYAKLEYLNPGFSKKDRAAKQIILDALHSGDLSPGQTVIELTSGNMGTGLAIVCKAFKLPFIAVMSKGNSEERARMMRALGAEVILVDQVPGAVPNQVSGDDLARVEEVTQKLTKERDAFRADQFINQGNFRAHYLHTAQEYLEQTQFQIDAFCDFVGSGGTFAGCATAFKEYNKAIACYVVEPSGAAVLAGKKVSDPSHKIQGGGYSMTQLSLLKTDLIDGFLQVTDEEAMAVTRQLAEQEGIFCGFSSGANVAAALQLLRHANKSVAVVINDSGLKYLSTDLWK